MPKKFSNNVSLVGENNEGKVKRYTHQPLTVEHYGIHAAIQENGKVKITFAPTPIKGTDEFEFDEVEIPASLIFKLFTLLKATRSVKFVSVGEAKSLPPVEE